MSLPVNIMSVPTFTLVSFPKVRTWGFCRPLVFSVQKFTNLSHNISAVLVVFFIFY